MQSRPSPALLFESPAIAYPHQTFSELITFATVVRTLKAGCLYSVFTSSSLLTFLAMPRRQMAAVHLSQVNWGRWIEPIIESKSKASIYWLLLLYTLAWLCKSLMNGQIVHALFQSSSNSWTLMVCGRMFFFLRIVFYFLNICTINVVTHDFCNQMFG